MLSGIYWRSCLCSILLSATLVQSAELVQALFTESMTIQDAIYDPSVSYLRYFYYPLAAGSHETRSTVWYSVGLLQPVKILRNIIHDQEKNVSAQWYGDYTVYPEQPAVGSPAYPPMRLIGTALIIIYEEFRSLLPKDVQDLVLESLYNSTIGDSYRVGGVDGDNLYPAYSNAWLMRTVVSSWTGHKLNDANMTAAGDADAKAFFDLFDRNQTLSEFNGPTYAGVSLYALTIAAKYLQSTKSTIGQHAVRAVQQIWDYEAQLWNPHMRNIAGPWDRSYGYDMNNYVAIMSIWLWTLIGKDGVWKSSSPIWTMAHGDDLEIAPVIAVLSDFHRKLISSSTISRLKTFDGEHTYTGHAYAPPSESVVGGFSEDSSSFSPSVIQWIRSDQSIGYFNLYPTETALKAELAPCALNLTYPLGNASSTFTFAVASNPLGKKRDITTLVDLDGINIEVDGTVDPVPVISFCGLVGGDCEPIHGFEFWNVTFLMPANSTETPHIQFKFGLE
ncbi:hypothetical protein BJX63DRAFT_426536 [Aspergillus granulosus]|uniref:Uncharacterized protein n=1 Tax=Aspergillus granulosus TaxID=176169 RepID=A0ABR4GRY1_9EURO